MAPTSHKWLFLFDIDGTLLRTTGLGMRSMYEVADRLFGPGFRWEGIDPAGHLDPLIYAEVTAINRLPDAPRHHQRFHDEYIEQLGRNLAAHRDKVRALPGVHDTLARVRAREQSPGDVVLGLLTGNYARAVPVKLAAIGVEDGWFGVRACGDDGATRPDLVPVAMRRFAQREGAAADPSRVVVIGDTPRDVACAKAHGCVAVAVATGSYTQARLAEAGADLVLADLADSTALLGLVDGTRPAPAGGRPLNAASGTAPPGRRLPA